MSKNVKTHGYFVRMRRCVICKYDFSSLKLILTTQCHVFYFVPTIVSIEARK